MARSFALSTSTLAIACPAELEKDPAGVVTMPIVWATAAAVRKGAHRTTARSDFMVDPPSYFGGLGRHFFGGRFLFLRRGQQRCRKSGGGGRSGHGVQAVKG